VLAGFFFIVEKIVKEISIRAPTYINKVIMHPSKVIEIQIKKKGFKMLSGQYVFVCVPEIALYQWHPFTLTSAPEEDFLSVHIRVVGDWTTDLSERLGCRWDKKGKVLATQTAIGYAAR